MQIRNMFDKVSLILLLLAVFCFVQCAEVKEPVIEIKKGDHVVLVGNNLCSRMLNFGDFETELYMRYGDSLFVTRNMCDGGNTAGFRQHSGRISQWAFPGANEFNPDYDVDSKPKGHFDTPDAWLSKLETDVIIGFFGFNESFQGEAGVENFKAEIQAYIDHLAGQRYNGESAPRLVLVSPIAFEDLSDKYDLPDGQTENENLKLYTDALREVAESNTIAFVDVFTSSSKWFAGSDQMTIDGSQMNAGGYSKFGPYLVNEIFGGQSSNADRGAVEDAVKEKNFLWHNDFKIPNGVHVFGRRYNPFGPDNYPAEYVKIREMTTIRDSAVWAAANGEAYDLAAADAKTSILPEVESNYKPGDYGRGSGEYLYGQDALDKLTVPDGYKVELFASEKEFPDLANPVQLSFDNKGRLWVATMPSYPHWKPGDPRPDDKLIILEDTDDDGKADKQTTFLDKIHLPVGFEIAHDGVYVSQGTNLKFFKDTDGDDKADYEEIIFSGFDDHDTHHNASAFCTDPSGAIYMGEGVFLHTSVETSYGPVRATNGGFYRFNPTRRHLERTAQLSIPNPWGIAFDKWGQNFFMETSGPAMRWMMPGSVKPRYGKATHKGFDLIDEEAKVRPTSGLEFVSSSHFPDEVQGDMIFGNAIGFLGVKQHQIEDDSTGYDVTLRQNLLQSDDTNFRPVDLEFAPDGSLYVVDWHNVLVGHMQHNARDPYRDHAHGRIYRITYPSKPLVEPAKIDGASLDVLFDNLLLPEYRSRYRTRRELRGRDQDQVLSKLDSWSKTLDDSSADYERHLLEGLWVSWGANKITKSLLNKLMDAKDFRVRTAAVRVLRYMGHQVDNNLDLLAKAANDPEGRVRLEATVAASWLNKADGLSITQEASKYELDRWMVHAHMTSTAHLQGEDYNESPAHFYRTHLKGEEAKRYYKGMEIYKQEGFCGTCHQENGEGLPASSYPPLAGTKWALGDEERLIKLTLKGLHGPITVLGKDYPGQVPMTPYEGMLNDEEVASVLTFVRNSFGNKASAITPDMVKKVRAAVADRKGFYAPQELLNEHPLESESD